MAGRCRQYGACSATKFSFTVSVKTKDFATTCKILLKWYWNRLIKAYNGSSNGSSGATAQTLQQSKILESHFRNPP